MRLPINVPLSNYTGRKNALNKRAHSFNLLTYRKSEQALTSYKLHQ